jgi:hypothetical protein
VVEMKTLHYSIIAILVLSTLLYFKPAQADSTGNLKIQDIKTLPTAIIINHTFKINATLVNNSTSPIFVERGSCESPFSATFDSHVLVRTNNVNCTLNIIEQRLDPGKKITATSPYLDVTYVAAEAGTANATVTFRYSIWDQDNQSSVEEKVSAPFSFKINPITKVPTLTPSDNNELVAIATSIPGMQSWSHDWQFVNMGFMTAKNQPGNWQYVIVNLKAPSSSAPFPCEDDWWASVTIDRSTMKIVDATYPTMEDHGCGGMLFGGGPQSSVTELDNTTKPESPLQQLKSGIHVEDIQCKQPLILFFKAEDGTPACANLDTANALVERGWARDESAQPDGSTHYTAETNSTIIPGDLPRGSCGVMLPYYTTSRIINYTGFAGAYPEQFMFHGTLNDYVLVPGHHATITYEIDAGLSHGQSTMGPVTAPAYLNMTNYAIFYHEITNLEDLARYPGVTIDDNQDFKACFTRPTGQGSCIGGMPNGQGPIEAYVTGHQGVDVLFEPPAEMLQLDTSQEKTSKIVTLTITADKDTPRGTYLTVLSSECGGVTFLLTIGEQPYHE